MVNEARLIHIHEDAWGMRSLHPLGARDAVRADLAAAIAASDLNRDPSGHGWTDLHTIATPAIDFRTLLAIEAARAALAPLMPVVSRFHATAGAGFSGHDAWGSYDEAAVCYGFDATCFLKLDCDGGHITAVWFECRTPDAARTDALLTALRAIDAQTPCCLVDHWLKVEGAVTDQDFMRNYMELLALG